MQYEQRRNYEKNPNGPYFGFRLNKNDDMAQSLYSCRVTLVEDHLEWAMSCTERHLATLWETSIAGNILSNVAGKVAGKAALVSSSQVKSKLHLVL